MILYTMMPQELIFPADLHVTNKLTSVNINGIPLLVSQANNGGYEIVRLLSSDPQHYLESRFMPGAKIIMNDLGN